MHSHPSHWLKASSASCHLIPSMHGHVVVWSPSSSSFSTSSSSPSSTSSWFLPWCLTRFPWKIPCATPASGAWSAWTMSQPRHNFTKHDHTQSFSTKHNLRFVLRKRYAWRRKMSHTTKYLNPRRCRVLYLKRIRKVNNRINPIQKRENPSTTKANRPVTEKLVAVTSTIVSQAYRIPQSNNMTRIAKKQSKSWFSSSRITQTRILSCRTWRRLQKFTSSAKSRRSWSATWAIRRSFELCETPSKIQCANWFYIGKLALKTAHVVNSWSLRKGLDSWTWKDLMSCQFLVTSSKKNPTHGARHLCGSKCTLKQRTCYWKPAKTRMVIAKLFWKRWNEDDNYRKSFFIQATVMRSVQEDSIQPNMTQLHRKIIPLLWQKKKEIKTRNPGKFSVNR